MNTPASPPLALPVCPFRGLGEFRFADRDIFSGRKEETAKLLRTITIYRGVLFYGDSGTGKSSLISAGLVPEVLKEGFVPERLRVQPRKGEEIVVERFPESDQEPIIFLPSRLADDELLPRFVLSAEVLERRLRALKPGPFSLLIFDQFEELVTLTEEGARGTIGKEAYFAQQRIIELIARLLRDPGFQGKLLFVLREDYLAKLTPLFGRAPELTDQFVRLAPLSNEYLHSVIRGPFELTGAAWNTTISEDLAGKLASDIESRGDPYINLSEVQVACLQLWLSSNPAELYARRGVEGLLEDFLEQSLANMKELADPAVAVLSRMVTASGTRNVVSEDDAVQAVVGEDRLSVEHVKKALTALVTDTKLVRRELRHNTYFYEIVSEFLVPWISRQRAKRKERIRLRGFIKKTLIGLGAFLVACCIAGYVWFEGVRYKNTVRAIQTQLVQEEKRRSEGLRQRLSAQQHDSAMRISEERASIAQLNKDIADERRKNSDLKAYNTGLVGQVASLRRDEQGLQTKLQASESDLEQYRSRVNTFDADAAKIQAEMDAKTRDTDSAHLRALFTPRTYIFSYNGPPLTPIYTERPGYPAIAKAARISGKVELLVKIGVDGAVKETAFISGPAMLIQASKDAVSKWIYKPILINGKPVEVITIVPITFNLGG
jgi:hypothetical protein